jgi:hypothetical protein
VKTAILVGAGALIAWVATWSFGPEPASAPSSSPAAAVRPAERVAPPPRLASTPATPETPLARSPEQQLASLEAARDDGRWTVEDREQLRQALATLPADQANDFMRSLARAINAGKLEVDAPIL